MATLKVLRGNTSSIANYAGQAGEVALNYETGNLVFWTNTANVYYTLAAAGGGGGAPAAQGSISGYTAGGNQNPNTKITAIDKFSFISDASATTVGDLTIVGYDAAGQSSSTHGYTSGGIPATITDRIEKFPFASDTDSTNTGAVLSLAKFNLKGLQSSTHGYTTAGRNPGVTPTYLDTIDKFPFSSDANATDIGEISVGRSGHTTNSSSTHGYSAGGYDGTAATNAIDKFPFSSDSPASDVGELTAGKSRTTGQSGATHGYVSGGINPWLTTIEKYSFSSDGSATSISNLTQARGGGGGQSSTTSGYASGGYNPALSPIRLDTIDKFPFSSDSDATDVGELTIARYGQSENQV